MPAEVADIIDGMVLAFAVFAATLVCADFFEGTAKQPH
jgi:hypothetical protein